MLARYGIHRAHHQDGISSHAERKLLEQAPLLKLRAYKVIRPTRRWKYDAVLEVQLYSHVPEDPAMKPASQARNASGD